MATTKDEITTLKNLLGDIQGKLDDLVNSNQDLRARVKVMEVAAPSELRALSQENVRNAIAEDSYVRFEVLSNWRGQLRQGAIVRADHYPHLVDYVGAGLQLGAPRDHGVYIAQVKAEQEARVQAAKADTMAAQASAAKAQAISAEIAAMEHRDATPQEKAAQAVVRGMRD